VTPHEGQAKTTLVLNGHGAVPHLAGDGCGTGRGGGTGAGERADCGRLPNGQNWSLGLGGGEKAVSDARRKFRSVASARTGDRAGTHGELGSGAVRL